MIVVFGSINADLLFPVDALPRAGETVLCPDYRAAPGGKGLNQAVAAARARRAAAMPVRMVGCVGTDAFAACALDALKEAGVETGRVARSARPTGCAAVVVDRAAENQIAVASGANRDLAPEALPAEWLGPGTVLVLQREVPPAANRAVIARAVARRHGVTTVVSLGGAGARAFAPDGAWRCGALAIAPVDTVGAGDAFVAGLALGLAAGAPLPETLHRASVGAGLACLGRGGAPAMPAAAAIDARLADLAPARAL